MNSSEVEPPRGGDHDTGPKSRRSFLTGLGITLGGLSAAVVGIPFLGFLLSPLLKKESEDWRQVGSVNEFHTGTTTRVTFTDPSPLPWAGVASRTAAWLRRESDDQFTAFAVNCTHLGCPVTWSQDAELFFCPCHGGVYYSDGAVAAGPPPRPLATYEVRVRSGQVEVRTGPIPISTG